MSEVDERQKQAAPQPQRPKKSLNDLFSKYSPDPESRLLFDCASGYTVARSNINPGLYEVTVSLPRLFDTKIFSRIENGIKSAYGGKYAVRLVPSYGASLFSPDSLDLLISDAHARMLLPAGFFDKYNIVENDSDDYTVEIPFGTGGIDFLAKRNAESKIEELVKREFSTEIRVTIAEMADYVPYSETEEGREFYRSIEQSCRESLEEYGREEPEEAPDVGEAAEEVGAAPVFKKIRSVFDPSAVAVVEDGICSIGSGNFDISSPEFIFGDRFNIDPISVSSITSPRRNTVILGTVSDIQCDNRGRQQSWFCSFTAFDGNASITVRESGLEEDDARKMASLFSEGDSYAFFGNVRKDIKQDEFYFVPEAAARVSFIPRADRSAEKRVELHLHTGMSAVDGITSAADAVKTAMRWGHRALAVTDHGNVQAFPEVMLFLEKYYSKSGIPENERFLPIYGMEAYFVNDSASPLEGKYAGGFDGDTVVFDLETTGLSASTCKIIEFGAVRLKNGEVTGRFSTFVDPGVHIPEEITEVTSIRDSDVAGAPCIAEVLPEFFEFAKGALLVAHNADFDTGFLRAAADSLGIEFNSPYLDTVALSRFLNPGLSKHKLDTLADYYGLGDFNHHRAVDDAEMLSKIYLRMTEQLKERDIDDFDVLKKEIEASSDPKKLRSHHMIILVKDRTGLKNLYRMISDSYLKYYYRNPRIPKTLLDKNREGLIIGSACSAGELYSAILDNKPETELEEIASYYDYLEIQPSGNDEYLIDEGRVADREGLRKICRKIVELGERLGKPVVATSDSHFLEPEDEIYRRILQVGNKMRDADRVVPLYLRTTEEMLDEFSYLGSEKAYEVVVKNTNLIADMIERVRPIPEGSYPPHLEGSEEALTEKCWTRAKNMYGDPLPGIVEQRLRTELDSIISNGFAVLYVIAERLVEFSEKNGYLVGSRGSVGSSFAATMAGISEVNPLPPHYYCPKCRFSDFSNPDRAGSGFDLPSAVCPVCGADLMADGQDIPFETFLGFKGDKTPDIDLNFSGEVQGRVHKFTEELFGAENVFKAGTISTLADKTAYGYIMKYFEGKGIMPPKAEIERMKSRCTGVKKTTGQHPGGIIVVPSDMDVYDFTPVQHPADKAQSDIVTTHYAFSYLHDTILKLDELGHDIPTKYRYLEKYSGVPVMDVAMNDRTVYRLFESTEPLGIPQRDREDRDTRSLGLMVGTLGIPEMGTQFIQQVLIDSKPKNFADLMQISGLTHGTDVWLGNAQDLIKQGICDISHVVGTRDGIMLDLIKYGVEKPMAFKIMEKVRKNKKGEPLPEEMLDAMAAAGVPDWYVGSLKKIKYMFPKAHAAAYVMSAIRLAWYKVHRPVAFYCAIFTVAPEGFSAGIVGKGVRATESEILRIDRLGKDATANEKNTESALQLAHECMLRGIRFLPVDIVKSDAVEFLPENGGIRMPLTSLPGLGEAAARAITAARAEEPFFSVEDLRERGGANKSVIDVLRANGVLDGLNESDQLSVFDIM